MTIEFGEQLREARRRAGLTQQELGKGRYSTSYISLLESGKREPTQPVLQDFAESLGLDEAELRSWTSAVRPQDIELAAAAHTANTMFNLRDFAASLEAAEHAAQIATEIGDTASAWNLSFLTAECHYALSDYAPARSIMEDLFGSPLAARSDQLRSKAATFLSSVHRLAGDFQMAIDLAEDALAAANSARCPVDSAQASMALIAAATELGKLDQAWDTAAALEASLKDPDLPRQTRGKAAWAIGNTAYARKDIETGLSCHGQAAELLQPGDSLELWTHFLQGAASARLRAGLADDATENLINQAELASTLLKPLDDEVKLRLLRARWYALTDSPKLALPLLEKVQGQQGKLSSSQQAELGLLLGQVNRQLGRQAEAKTHFISAAKRFADTGLAERASEALAELIDIEVSAIP